MAKQNRNKSAKRKKEFDRMQKAKEKMAKRQGKKNKTAESDESPLSEQPIESLNN